MDPPYKQAPTFPLALRWIKVNYKVGDEMKWIKVLGKEEKP